MFDKKIIIETLDHVYVEDEKGDTKLSINQMGTTVRDANFKVFDNVRNAWDFVDRVVSRCQFNVFDYFVTGKNVKTLDKDVEMSELLNVLIAAPYNDNIEFKELIWDEVDQGEPKKRGLELCGSILMGAAFLQEELKKYIWDLLKSNDALTRRKGLVRSALFLPSREYIETTMFKVNAERERGKKTPNQVLKAVLKNNGSFPEDDADILRVGNLKFSLNRVIDD